jgi:hypothetical protein
MPRPPPQHAFIDESIRPGWYYLTAGIVATSEVHSVTIAAKAALPAGRQRAHFSREKNQRRRQILNNYCGLPVGVVVASAEYNKGDDQRARNACLESLLGQFSKLNVGVAVLDTRSPDRDKADRREIARVIREGGGPKDLKYSHRGSRDEPLLSLPDAFGWCVGAGGIWKKRVETHGLILLGA